MGLPPRHLQHSEQHLLSSDVLGAYRVFRLKETIVHEYSEGDRSTQSVPAAAPLPAESTVEEKVDHQRISLTGDFLSALDSSGSGGSSGEEAAAAEGLVSEGLADLWQQTADAVLGAAAGHASASVRSAAQGVIGSISPARFGALGPSLQQRLLAWACAGASRDEASPVRAAAAKALVPLVASDALLALPQGESL